MIKNLMMVIAACSLAGGIANAQIAVPFESHDDIDLVGVAAGKGVSPNNL
jgi:hypothetical protein